MKLFLSIFLALALSASAQTSGTNTWTSAVLATGTLALTGTEVMPVITGTTTKRTTTQAIANLATSGTGGGSITTTNIAYVSTTGSNSTALQNDPAHPFRTINAAAHSGTNAYTVEVWPGNYDEQVEINHGVSFHFMDGVVLNYTGSNAGQVKISGDGCKLYKSGTNLVQSVFETGADQNELWHIDVGGSNMDVRCLVGVTGTDAMGTIFGKRTRELGVLSTNEEDGIVSGTGNFAQLLYPGAKITVDKSDDDGTVNTYTVATVDSDNQITIAGDYALEGTARPGHLLAAGPSDPTDFGGIRPTQIGETRTVVVNGIPGVTYMATGTSVGSWSPSYIATLKVGGTGLNGDDACCGGYIKLHVHGLDGVNCPAVRWMNTGDADITATRITASGPGISTINLGGNANSDALAQIWVDSIKVSSDPDERAIYSHDGTGCPIGGNVFYLNAEAVYGGIHMAGGLASYMRVNLNIPAYDGTYRTALPALEQFSSGFNSFVLDDLYASGTTGYAVKFSGGTNIVRYGRLAGPNTAAAWFAGGINAISATMAPSNTFYKTGGSLVFNGKPTASGTHTYYAAYGSGLYPNAAGATAIDADGTGLGQLNLTSGTWNSVVAMTATKFSLTTGSSALFLTGTAIPTSTLAAPAGTVYIRNSGASAGIYLKSTGTSTAGWLTVSGT